MPCTHYITCPLFKYFSSHPVLNLWRINYCDKPSNIHCVRFQHTSRGLANPVSLLPNGKQIELAPLTLFNAARNNRLHLIVNILSNIDIDINFQNIDGMTVLMVAAEQGNTEMAEVLLQHGANTKIENYNCETAYHIAQRTNNEKTATLLQRYSVEKLSAA